MASYSFGKGLVLLMMVLPASYASADASFDWFTYQAADSAPPQTNNTFSNPILPGFYPDPSITRKDDTYYLVNSSFAYTPGLPIFKSQDLVHWEQVGHALSEASQADFTGLGTSRGITTKSYRSYRSYTLSASAAIEPCLPLRDADKKMETPSTRGFVFDHSADDILETDHPWSVGALCIVLCKLPLAA